MNSVNATYAKQNFGACLAEVVKNPVVIEKSGKPAAVMISYEDYQRLASLEDAYWLAKAQAASTDGYLSTEESEKVMLEAIARAGE